MNPVLYAEWIRGEYNEITYISNDSLAKTQKILSEVELFKQNFIHHVVPDSPRKNWPLRIIICKDSETFTSLSPIGTKYENDVAGVYTPGLAYDLILLRSDAKHQQMRSAVYHEMTHRLLRRELPLPLWLDEGLAEFYSGYKISRKKIEFGIRDVQHCRWINKRGLLPLMKTFHVHHRSIEYNEINRSRAFYATCWAFVHYCMLNENTNIRNAFDRFCEYANEHTIDETIFKEIFSMSYSEVEEQLEKYSRKFSHPSLKKVKIPIRIDQEFNFENLSTTQINTFKLGALTLSDRYEEASALLDKMNAIFHESDLKNHQLELLTEKVQLNYLTQQYEKAQKIAQTAFINGSKNPAVLLVYAEKLLHTMPGERVWVNYYIPNKTLNTAMSCINNVLEMNTHRAHAWNLYALAWLRSETTPEYKHIQKLIQICDKLPTNANLHFLTSDLLHRSNRKHMAKGLLRKFISESKNQREKQEAQKRLNRIR